MEHPERHRHEVASVDTDSVGPSKQEYGVKVELSYRGVADLGASDLASDGFFSGFSAHLRVCEKCCSTQELCMEENLLSASRSDVDSLSQSGYTKGGCKDPQGQFQGNARCPHGVYGGGTHLRLGGLADQNDLEQGRSIGGRDCLSGL